MTCQTTQEECVEVWVDQSGTACRIPYCGFLLNITIDADNSIYLNRDIVSLPDVDSALHEMQNGLNHYPLIIRMDPDAKVNSYLEVMKIVQQSSYKAFLVIDT